MRIAQAAVVALLGVGLLSACTVTTDVTTGKPSNKPSSRTTVRTDVDVPTQQQPPQQQGQQQGQRHVVSVARAGGLVKLTGQEAVSDVVIDPGEVRPDMTLVMENYRRPGQQGDPVLVVAVDNVPEDTSVRREHLWRGLLQYVGWTEGASAEPYDAGPLGGSVECFLASLAEDGNTICGWADESTAGVALFPDSNLPTASAAFVAMRADIER